MTSVARQVDQQTRPLILATIEPEEGQETRVDLSAVVISLTFEDVEKKADQLTLTVDNFDGSAFDTEIFAKGNIIRWQWGYPGFMSPRRDSVITETTGGTVLTVKAKSRSVLMARKTVVRTYENVTRSEVVTEIAERNGFGAANRTIEETEEIFETILQPNISDARMLVNLAHKEGFEFYVDHKGLFWGPRGFDRAPTRRFVWYGRGSRNREGIIDYTIKNDLTAKPAKTVIKGINPDTKQTIEAVGSNAETDRPVLQEVVEIRDFETGQWVKQTRAATEEIKPTSEVTEEAAKKRADGRFRKVSQRAVKMSIDVIADPLILAKTVVEIGNIATRIDGRYYIEKVTTTIDSSGAKQKCELITDGSRGTQGVTINDAIFSPQRTTLGSGDPFDVSLRMLTIMSDVQGELIVNSQAAAAAGINISTISAQLDQLDARLESDPNDAAAYQQIVQIGNTLASKPAPLKGLGRALKRNAQRGISAVENAESGGTLNTKPLIEDDRSLEGYENVDGDQEWRPR